MDAGEYVLVVKGHLGSRYRAAFPGMDLATEGTNTRISGPVTDRSHLSGLLDRIESLGLDLVSVSPATTAGDSHPVRHPAPPRSEGRPDGR